VVGIVVEDGKYGSLAEDPKPAMFLPVLQSPTSETTLVLRSNRDPQQLVAAIRCNMKNLDTGLPFEVRTWSQALESALFPSRMATLALGVLGVMGAMLSITGIFGLAAYSVSKRLRELGIRVALAGQRGEVLRAALGACIQVACGWFGGRIAPRNSGEPGAGFDRLSGKSARPAGIGWCRLSDVVAGATGYLDSSAMRPVD